MRLLQFSECAPVWRQHSAQLSNAAALAVLVERARIRSRLRRNAGETISTRSRCFATGSAVSSRMQIPARGVPMEERKARQRERDDRLGGDEFLINYSLRDGETRSRIVDQSASINRIQRREQPAGSLSSSREREREREGKYIREGRGAQRARPSILARPFSRPARWIHSQSD